MPATYPPIAPRGPNSNARPVIEPQPREIVSHGLQSESGDTLARLAALEASPESFADAHHPVRDAVTIALLKPAGELIKRHVARQRAVQEALQAPLDSDDPTEPPMALVNDDHAPAWLAMAETMVAKALLGDVKAFTTVADRIEGKAGLRKADLDAETAAQRERVRGTIEELVRSMGDRRRAAAEEAQPVDVDIIDPER